MITKENATDIYGLSASTFPLVLSILHFLTDSLWNLGGGSSLAPSIEHEIQLQVEDPYTHLATVIGVEEWQPEVVK